MKQNYDIYDDFNLNIFRYKGYQVTFMVELRACILVQATIYRRVRIDRDGHPDQSETYDMS